MTIQRYRITAHIPHILGGVAIIYFVFHMINGDRGLVSYIRARNEMRLLTTEMEILKARNASLENKIGLLRDDNIDYDMLEEQAMRSLGIVRQGDIVILVPSK